MTVVDLYTVQLIRDGELPRFMDEIPDVDSVQKMMAETEENLTDLLPPGYRARIRRWDHPDEPTQEDEDA